MNEELTEQGIVLNSQNGFVEVELIKNENCEDCSAKIFCNPTKDSSQVLRVKDSLKLEKGDTVTISILGKNLLAAALNLYLYPLLILVSSIFLGTQLFSNSNNVEIYSFLLGLILVMIYYLLFFNLSKNIGEYEPNIVISKYH